ncbi:MAG TPA: DUF6675 family protein [Reyranella sp.]|nr:DUF6675 family protein [Reyranella sp.]
MRRTVVLCLAVAALVAPMAVRAEPPPNTASATPHNNLPRPPCDSGPAAAVPAYGPVDGAADPGTWQESDLLREHWQPSACLGWYGNSRMVVALSSRFHSSLGVGALAARLAAVSLYPSIKFWAITRQQWRPLTMDAWVIQNPQEAAKARHPDPVSEQLVPGHDVLYAEDPDIGGRTIYRLRVTERTDNRLVITTENITSVRVALFTIFPPGSLQIVSFLDRQGPNTWGLYEIARATEDASSMVTGYQGAYLNRLEAVRRHLAGLPTDRDPPIARW